MKSIEKYFPSLTDLQKDQFSQLYDLYFEWNQMINVISRKDIENLYTHHVLHSLAIAKFINFVPSSSVLDLGTGGGFPGIPLAILYPETKFLLVDSIGKKLKVIDSVAEQLGLANVSTRHIRVEEIKGQKFDFVVTRAVAKADKLLSWCRTQISTKQINAIPNGLIALKGGNIKDEVKLLPKNEYYELEEISNYFDETYFDEKYILYIQGDSQ